MQVLDRRKALWIEVAVVTLWLVILSLVAQAVRYASPVPGSRDGYRFLRVLVTAGKIGALGFIVWQSGDSFRSFGVVNDRIWRVLGLTALLFALGMASAVIGNPDHTIPHLSTIAFARRSTTVGSAPYYSH